MDRAYTGKRRTARRQRVPGPDDDPDSGPREVGSAAGAAGAGRASRARAMASAMRAAWELPITVVPASTGTRYFGAAAMT